MQQHITQLAAIIAIIWTMNWQKYWNCIVKKLTIGTFIKHRRFSSSQHHRRPTWSNGSKQKVSPNMLSQNSVTWMAMNSFHWIAKRSKSTVASKKAVDFFLKSPFNVMCLAWVWIHFICCYFIRWLHFSPFRRLLLIIQLIQFLFQTVQDNENFRASSVSGQSTKTNRWTLKCNTFRVYIHTHRILVMKERFLNKTHSTRQNIPYAIRW